VDRTSLVSAVAASIAEVLMRDLPDLTEQTRLFEDLQLDSTTILELLMALEDGIGIEVDPESLDMDVFASVGTLADYIGDQLAAVTS
jgi:acyl carrier protein